MYWDRADDSMAIPPIPPWLIDEPELQTLLNAVLDRFDKQPGETRQQRLPFSAEEHLPSLKRLDAEADQLWQLVQKLQQHDILSIKEDKKRGPYDADWKGARLAFATDAEETLRTWLQRPREEPATDRWRSVVKQHADAFPGDIEALLKRRINLPGWDDEQTVMAFSQIASIDIPMTLRQLSARLFAGDSKRLDDKEELIRTLFPELKLKPRPLVIAVHLPGECHGVLFIENQDTYVAAVSGAYRQAQNLALVYAAGFRGGAERIRDREAALLHYSGSQGQSSHFEAWWYNSEAEPPGPLYFFGDLDFSGMAILSALRQRFGNVTAWEHGYSSLLEKLHSGLGHHPEAANKHQQCDPGITGCPYTDKILLPAARRLGFIDQEAFTGNTETDKASGV